MSKIKLLSKRRGGELHHRQHWELEGTAVIPHTATKRPVTKQPYTSHGILVRRKEKRYLQIGTIADHVTP